MRLSILVVSRTAELLNKMLDSLASATNLNTANVEVLCSWNGSQEEEKEILNKSGYKLQIAQRDPYHFASNMNNLAKKANGELLLLINDDIIMDEKGIDFAIECLEANRKAGLIGARLRDKESRLAHAGIMFDSDHHPYHKLMGILQADDKSIIGEPRVVPAVTGALMLIRRKDFSALTFDTKYLVCGEDVSLCLDIRMKLKLEIWYCPNFSASHEVGHTRHKNNQEGNNSEDLQRMRKHRCEFLEIAKKPQLRQELSASIAEAEALRESLKELKENLRHHKEISHSLQLHRLQLEQRLQNHQQVGHQ